MIASHFAQSIERALAAPTIVRDKPSDDGEELIELAAGEPFGLLDDTSGWAWGYAGKDRRVGYVRSEMLAKA